MRMTGWKLALNIGIGIGRFDHANIATSDIGITPESVVLSAQQGSYFSFVLFKTKLIESAVEISRSLAKTMHLRRLLLVMDDFKISKLDRFRFDFL